jgi:hypothetical protein
MYGNVGWNSSNFTFFIDATYPLIEFGVGSEVNNTNWSRDWVYVNVSVTETNEANITFGLYNASYYLMNESFFSTSQRTVNWTGLADGSYYYNVTIIDEVGNVNFTETREITLDATAPNATLITPVNNTYTNDTSQNLTVNTTDNLELDNATLYIYNETDDLINQTSIDLAGSEYFLGIIYEFLYDGIFRWFYRIVDIAGNPVSTSNNTITIDTTYPLIDYGLLTAHNNSNLSQSNIFVNVSVTETNPVNMTYLLFNDSEEVNSTTFVMEDQSSNNTINWTGLADGSYYYNVSVVDIVNNINFTETRKITLDATAPNATLITPLQK